MLRVSREEKLEADEKIAVRECGPVPSIPGAASETTADRPPRCHHLPLLVPYPTKDGEREI